MADPYGVTDPLSAYKKKVTASKLQKPVTLINPSRQDIIGNNTSTVADEDKQAFLKTIVDTYSNPANTGDTGDTGDTGSTGSYSGLSNFSYNPLDRSKYDLLAQKIYDAQKAQLDQSKKDAESSAYNSQVSARGDYFDQYRQAQYNRAGSGLGTSPLGATGERQVQLGQASTIADIWNTLASNKASLDAQDAEAYANKDINAESMYQTADNNAFSRAMSEWSAKLQQAQLAQNASAQAQDAKYNDLNYNEAVKTSQAQDTADSITKINNQITYYDDIIDNSKDYSKVNQAKTARNNAVKQLAQLQGVTVPNTVDYKMDEPINHFQDLKNILRYGFNYK